MKKIVMVLLCFAVVLSVSGCFTRPAVAPETSKINIYTSFYPLYDFAVKIGGDRVDVVNMIPAGIEPHDWEPSPQLLTALLKADILLFNGLGLDLWVEKTAETLKAGKVMLVNTSDGIEPLRGYKHDHGHDHEDECDGHDHEDECDDHEDGHDHEDECDGHEDGHDSTPDPHIWLDPLLALHQAEKILQALVAVDPANADYYKENYENFKEQIESLHKAYVDGLRQVVRREFIVTHRSFGYLAHRYGLLQLGISGLSPHQEPGPGEMKDIVEFTREHNIKYIFREPLAAPRLAEVLAAEIGAEILVLNPLEGLTAADMAAGRDYFTVMYENLEQLKKALLE
jgi:zinc transport system substrate-binding protein